MSEKSKSTAFLLCYFFGLFGAHRFYLKRWITAILMLLTLGGLGIWWLIDAVLIIGGKFNDAHGQALRTGPPNPDNPHAGFWVRFAAISVDMIIVQLVVMVLGFVGSIALSVGAIANLSADDPAAIEQFAAASSSLMGIIFVVIVPLYFGLQTASSHQATVGKRVFDIRVSSNSNGRLNLLRGVWRTLCYVLSALPLFLGFILAAFTRNKRSLHDYLAGSKVVYVQSDSMMAGSQPVARRAASATSIRSSDAPDARQDTSTSDKVIVVLGVLALAGAAALALL